MPENSIRHDPAISGENDAPVEESVLRIVGDHLGIPAAALSPEDHLEHDLGADSLDRMELIMTVEEEFGVTIEERYISGIASIHDVTNAIMRYMYSADSSGQ